MHDIERTRRTASARHPGRRLPAPVISARTARYLLVVAIVAQVLSIWYVHRLDTHGYLDTEIYRLGARAWLNGFDLYGGDLTPETPDSGTLPFIYPPIAAILFVPLYWVPGEVAVVIVSTLSHLGILAAAYALARSSRYLATRARLVPLATASAMPLITLIEPARETVTYGQINLWLLGLVLADCLLPRTRWPRGLLVGIAAAIKLTPLGFLLFFLLRKDFRAASVAGLTFAASVLLGFLAAPTDAATWWLEQMVSTGGSQGPVYAGNLTLRSLLAKQELTGLALNSLWIGGSVVLLIVTILGIRYALWRGNIALALSVNAVLVVLVSPISWSHHWVWAGPTLVLLLAMAARRRWYGVGASVGLGVLVTMIGPQWHLPYGEGEGTDWTFAQQVVGNAYTLLGIAFLCTVAVGYFRYRHRVEAQHESGSGEAPMVGMRPG